MTMSLGARETEVRSLATSNPAQIKQDNRIIQTPETAVTPKLPERLDLVFHIPASLKYVKVDAEINVIYIDLVFHIRLHFSAFRKDNVDINVILSCCPYVIYNDRQTSTSYDSIGLATSNSTFLGLTVQRHSLFDLSYYRIYVKAISVKSTGEVKVIIILCIAILLIVIFKHLMVSKSHFSKYYRRNTCM